MVAACGLYCGACKKYRMGKCTGCHENEKEIFAFVFRSDRPACIRYIRENGEQAFAEEMTKRGEQTIRK